MACCTLWHSVYRKELSLGGDGLVDLALCFAACLPVFYCLRALAAETDQTNGTFSSAFITPVQSPAWWALIFSLSLLYWMHAAIWNYPKEFMALSRRFPLNVLGSTPVDVFARLEVLGKFQQMGSVLYFWGFSSCSVALRTMPSRTWVTAFALCALLLGQALNFATYAAIGEAGVYYGFKLGERIPWVEGFPFTTGLRHPQYTGVVLTLLACASWWVEDVSFRQEGVLLALLVWSSFYIFMCALEQSDDNDKSKTTD